VALVLGVLLLLLPPLLARGDIIWHLSLFIFVGDARNTLGKLLASWRTRRM
jgi:hypothetical protein